MCVHSLIFDFCAVLPCAFHWCKLSGGSPKPGWAHGYGGGEKFSRASEIRPYYLLPRWCPGLGRAAADKGSNVLSGEPQMESGFAESEGWVSSVSPWFVCIFYLCLVLCQAQSLNWILPLRSSFAQDKVNALGLYRDINMTVFQVHWGFLFSWCTE